MKTNVYWKHNGFKNGYAYLTKKNDAWEWFSFTRDSCGLDRDPMGLLMRYYEK